MFGSRIGADREFGLLERNLKTNLGSGFCVIDLERFAVKVLAVELCLGGVRIVEGVHLDERESFRTPRVAVGYQLTRIHRAHFAEEVSEFIAGGIRREISNK